MKNCINRILIPLPIASIFFQECFIAEKVKTGRTLLCKNSIILTPRSSTCLLRNTKRSRIICGPFWGSFAVSGSFAALYIYRQLINIILATRVKLSILNEAQNQSMYIKMRHCETLSLSQGRLNSFFISLLYRGK